MNFGGLEIECTSFEKATFVVVPVPYDLTSTYQSGSRRGPAAILEASGNMELYDEELRRETFLAGIHTMDPVEAIAGRPEAMIDAVRQRITEICALEKIPVVLGGEHSISLGAVQAVRDKYQDITVIQFDAHADLREEYQGTPYSHACVGRRIAELCPLVQVGIRSLSAKEAAFMEQGSVKTFYAGKLLDDDDYIKHICQTVKGNVYLSIDIDVLDPSFMPSTGTPEPAGLSWKNITEIIRAISCSCRIRGFDVVELAPIPGLVAPDFLTAKLIYRIMGYLTA
jgi:agmatinase